MDGDVVPGGDGKLFDVIRGGDVAVRAGKDYQGFAAGEMLPVRIGAGEMAFDEAVLAVVFDDQRQMRGGRILAFKRTKEDGERIGAHGLEDGVAVGDLVEFW